MARDGAMKRNRAIGMIAGQTFGISQTCYCYEVS